MEKLITPVQQSMLDAIVKHIDTQGMPPTRSELAATLGYLSNNGVQEILVRLEKLGRIELIPTARGIRIV